MISGRIRESCWGICNIGEINSAGEINPIHYAREINSNSDYLVRIALRRFFCESLWSTLNVIPILRFFS